MNISLTFLSGSEYSICVPKHDFNVNAHLSLSFDIILNILNNLNTSEYKYHYNSQFTFYLPEKNLTIEYEKNGKNGNQPITFDDIYNLYNDDNDHDPIVVVIMVMVKPFLDLPLIAEKYAKKMHFDEFQRTFIEDDFTPLSHRDEDVRDEKNDNMTKYYNIYWINYDKSNDNNKIVEFYRFYTDTNKTDKWAYTTLYLNKNNNNNFCKNLESFSCAKFTEMAKKRFYAILHLILNDYSSFDDENSKKIVESSKQFLTRIYD